MRAASCVGDVARAVERRPGRARRARRRGARGTSRARRLARCILAGDAERRECNAAASSGVADGEEAAGHRGRHAARPVTVASSGSPFATASSRSPSETWSTGPVTAATTPSFGRRTRDVGAAPRRADRLDAADLRFDAGERGDLAGVAAQIATSTSSRIRLRCRCEMSSRRRRRVENDGPPARVRSLAGEQHRLDPVRRERPDVEHERARERASPRPPRRRAPSRQRADRERRVRRLVHDDVVRDLVDQRLRSAARAASRRASRSSRPPRWKTSTGPSPAPSSASPCSTASDAVAAAARGRRAGPRRGRAARRASPSACSRRRASPQRRAARTGISSALAVEEVVDRLPAVPPVTIAAARRARPAAPPARRAPVAAGERLASWRFGVTTVASGNSRPTSTSTASSCEELRARARDHHGIDDERHPAAPNASATVSIGRRRTASRSWPRRRRCRRRRRRSARGRTPGAAREPP